MVVLMAGEWMINQPTARHLTSAIRAHLACVFSIGRNMRRGRVINRLGRLEYSERSTVLLTQPSFMKDELVVQKVTSPASGGDMVLQNNVHSLIGCVIVVKVG
jgi:hypothetical protein